MQVTMLMPIVVQVSVISCSKEFHRFSPLTVWKSFIIIRFMTFPFQWRPLFSLGEVGRIVPDLRFLHAIYYFAYFDHAHLYSLFSVNIPNPFNLFIILTPYLFLMYLRWANQK